MKIAVIAPPWSRLPTEDYTGIESTIANLCDELVKLGEEVFLFAPAGSVSQAQVIEYPAPPSDIDFDNASRELRHYFKDLIARYAYAAAQCRSAEIIHNFTLAGEEETDIPAVHTVYGPPKSATLNIIAGFMKYSNNYFVAVSNRQRSLFSESSRPAGFIRTVHKSVSAPQLRKEQHTSLNMITSKILPVLPTA